MSILHQASPYSGPGAPMIPITWPFAVWGLDLLGPFKKAPRGLTHQLVMVDKFTKSIEAKPLAKMGSRQAVDFIQDIIFCFRIPNSIIINNGTQFTSSAAWWITKP
jgi:hypothetical protein